jgi:hypothetical protein
VAGEAIGWETVQVAAGTFEAMKVAVVAGTTKSTCWYAEEVQRVVKCVFPDRESSWELVKYNVVK